MINNISMGFCIVKKPDEEHLRVIRKLLAYGKTPTYDKNTDIALLYAIEIEEAKTLNYINTNLLTVTKAEQEKIQNKKKEKRIENNPEKYPQSTRGQELLGEQIMLALKMKNKKDKNKK